MSEIIEKLAEWIHEDWRKGDYPKKPHLDVPYGELAKNHQEDNRAAARRIPDVLALAGFGLATREGAEAGTTASDDQVTRRIVANLERLSEAEHEGWRLQREKNGWRFGQKRDDARKLHPLMVPYNDLPEQEKDKDRNAVLAYPAKAKRAGFEIVWL